MKIFEIHITGEKSIIEELNNLRLKNITIELLSPNLQVLSTEHMSSIVSNHENYEDCKEYVDHLLTKIKSKIFRVKIECPVYPEYIDKALYIESHFEPFGNQYDYPLSKNVNSNKLLCTEREYKKEFFKSFQRLWRNVDVELCLYDDYIRQDFDWFEKYKL